MPWLEDVASLCVTAGVGVLNTNIFLSSSALIPPGDGPYLSIVETSGYEPERLHTDADGAGGGVGMLLNAAAYERPWAQLWVRGKDYVPTRAMSRAAWTAVDGIYNTTINGCWYREILALQRPYDMGPDDAKRVRVCFNIRCVKALS